MIKLVSTGIGLKEHKEMLGINEYISIGETHKINKYNEVEINVEFLDKKDKEALSTIAEKVAHYYKKNKAKNVEIVNCWSSSDKVYNGVLDKWLYSGWITITFKKEIKSLGRYSNNLHNLVSELIEEENQKEVVELKNTTTNNNTNNDVQFNPENTAIDINNATSAKIIAKEIKDNTKVLDYGCGTGRNIVHIMENSNAIVDGVEIAEQLKKEKDKHDKLREKGCLIGLCDDIKNESYDVVLNSHVLNVISDDKVKQFIVDDMYRKLKKGGHAYIEVRTKKDVEQSSTKEPYGDGWKITKGKTYTYQEGITKQKMINLVTNAGFKIENHICNSSKHIIKVAK